MSEPITKHTRSAASAVTATHPTPALAPFELPLGAFHPGVARDLDNLQPQRHVHLQHHTLPPHGIVTCWIKREGKVVSFLQETKYILPRVREAVQLKKDLAPIATQLTT